MGGGLSRFHFHMLQTSTQALATDSHQHEPLCPPVPREGGEAWIRRPRGQMRVLEYSVGYHLSPCLGLETVFTKSPARAKPCSLPTSRCPRSHHQAKYPQLGGAWSLGELSSGPSRLWWLCKFLQEKIYSRSPGNNNGVI